MAGNSWLTVNWVPFAEAGFEFPFLPFFSFYFSCSVCLILSEDTYERLRWDLIL
jgi:hypothetical protein